MAESTTTPGTEENVQTGAAAQSGKQQEFTPITSQEEFDERIKARIARVKSTPPADYDELKAKAARLDELEEASKSELQKATERADRLQKELEGMKAAQQRQALVEQVAKESGVDAELLATMSGATEDEVKANAELLKAKFAAVPGYQPDPHDNGGAHEAPPKREIPIIF